MGCGVTWDAAEGGRIILPLECSGRRGVAPPCDTAAIGVVDAGTLEWEYRVELDSRYIKRMGWVEVSPDGKLLMDICQRRLDRVSHRGSLRGAGNTAKTALAASKTF